jgi:hypothetical protein
MRLLYLTATRRLLVLAILLAALFFVRPQQTAYAMTRCCSSCDPSLFSCLDSSTPETERFCWGIWDGCVASCDSSC